MEHETKVKVFIAGMTLTGLIAGLLLSQPLGQQLNEDVTGNATACEPVQNNSLNASLYYSESRQACIVPNSSKTGNVSNGSQVIN